MADEYEAKNIAAGGEVLHRDKVVSRLTAFACLAMAMLFGALAVGGAVQGSTGSAIGLGIVALLSAFLALTRSVLRTVITHEDVRIHWGLWGPRIPLSAITSFRTRPASRTEMVKAAGEEGKPRIEVFQITKPDDIVELEWSDEAGKAHRAWLGAEDPAALCDAIRRTRADASARVRVGAGAGAGARVEELEHLEDQNSSAVDEPAAVAGTRKR